MESSAPEHLASMILPSPRPSQAPGGANKQAGPGRRERAAARVGAGRNLLCAGIRRQASAVTVPSHRKGCAPASAEAALLW
ncbi:hypothetical protein NDU88_004783 [Pleurodeles waltl]|uniref:Uncharacterized protein n=1 Tax=Pleurodeles waltl TaxID=8319 RepID=A0AAV7QFS0_PLEWA|nr:hypothetical protein NDU88_004783 [Pleurodeles waltl]